MTRNIEGMAWPRLYRDRTAELAALDAFLRDSEMQPAHEIARRQAEQLRLLVAHHAQHSPSFALRLREAGLSAADIDELDALRRLPVLTRAQCQAQGDALFAQWLPSSHLPMFIGQTSGSTGQPVTVRRTRVCSDILMAMSLRDHRWFGRDFTGRMALIRPQFTQQVDSSDWGVPVNQLHDSGQALALPMSTDIRQQAALLARFQPSLLVVYPSNLDGLLREWESGAPPAGLRHVKTIGETVTESLRQRLRDLCGLEIEDSYSSEEFGLLAMQCPVSGLYHVMAEAVHLEILRADGTPCPAGETGRVTVTDLTNFAAPMIRYDIGDYATAATSAPCACGRGLPTLQRIAGRERNLVRFPDGRQHWPLTGFRRFGEVLPVRQYQVIQTGPDKLELRIAADQPLDDEARQRLCAILCDAMGYPFKVDVHEFSDGIPAGANGKFEEFICRIEGDTQ